MPRTGVPPGVDRHPRGERSRPGWKKARLGRPVSSAGWAVFLVFFGKKKPEKPEKTGYNLVITWYFGFLPPLSGEAKEARGKG